MSLRENEWFIQAPWGRICVIAWGNCLDTPVLLCHGQMDSAVSLKPLVQRLPTNFYYIVDAVARHFDWETFVLIGHSLGAYVGKLYDISCPGKLSKLIELDPINVFGIEPENFSLWYQKFFTEFYEHIDKYNAPKERARKITWKQAVETLQKVRGISEQDAAATLKRWTEPAGDGLVRYTFDPRIKMISPPAFSPEHIKKLFTSTKTPTLSIVSKISFKKGHYRNTTFLLDESIYPAKNYRCRKVDGNHDVHIISPDVVATYVAQFLSHGLVGLDSSSKL